MSSFEEYRRTQMDMLHLVSHLLKLHREPGHWESSPEQRDAYDYIHHRFIETLHVAQARLALVGKAPAGSPSPAVQQARVAGLRPHSAMHRQKTSWGASAESLRTKRPARTKVFNSRSIAGDPFAIDPTKAPPPPRPTLH